jgi:hypothetical protein
MLQIIDEQPSFAQQLAKGAGKSIGSFAGGFGQGALQQREQKFNEGKAKQAYKSMGLSEELATLPMDIQKEFVKAHVTGKAQKQLEKENAMQIGLETIGKMRSLIGSAGPSNYVQSLFGGETTKNRAELEALGRSLIPLVAAGVPIRNQREFEEYRKVITNPNARQAELEGALNGLQGLFETSLAHSGASEKEPGREKKARFNSKNPEHQAKARQLYKTHKDKNKVREILEREFEF